MAPFRLPQECGSARPGVSTPCAWACPGVFAVPVVPRLCFLPVKGAITTSDLEQPLSKWPPDVNTGLPASCSLPLTQTLPGTRADSRRQMEAGTVLTTLGAPGTSSQESVKVIHTLVKEQGVCLQQTLLGWGDPACLLSWTWTRVRVLVWVSPELPLPRGFLGVSSGQGGGRLWKNSEGWRMASHVLAPLFLRDISLQATPRMPVSF